MVKAAVPAPPRRRKPDALNAIPPQPLSLPDQTPGTHGAMLRFPRRTDEQAGVLTNIESLLREILTELRGQRVVGHADRLDRLKRSAAEGLASD